MSSRSVIGGRAWRRFARLPLRARAALVVVIAAASVPAVLETIAAFHATSSWTGVLARRGFLTIAAACLGLGAVIAFEPPRSASPLAYARQIRARFLELECAFDADDRRRPGEGKEKEDDRVPPEP